ncbi:MAG TPA: WS/DGAT domain-containing protein, partial [Solirubrobacteraceae bacterium]
AIMSYNGGIDFGLLGDYDALPDIELIAQGIADALAELLAIARGEKAGAKRTKPGEARSGNGATPEPAPASEPTPIFPAAHGRPQRGPAADMRAKQRHRGSQPARKRSPEA